MMHKLYIPLGEVDGNSPGSNPEDETILLYYPPGWYDGVWFPQGLYLPMATRWETAPKTIDVNVGDTVRLTASFQYRGPAKSYTLYGAIGIRNPTWGLNDFWEGSPAGQKSFSVPESTSWVSRTATVDVVVPSSANLVSLYGRKAAIYVKAINGLGSPDVDKTMSPYYEDALNVAAREGEFGEMKISDYAKVG
jgi:hypothetical protein